jgi:16S rRNA G966 N2-methylase RsmD
MTSTSCVATCPDAAVDLVYLDPPFNSNRDYKL